MTSKVSVLLFTGLIIVASTSALPRAQIPSQSGNVLNNPKLNFLGAVNGKNFYMYDSELLNWGAAKTFAQSQNLNLAAISTTEEEAFFRDVSLELLPVGQYWTSATDMSTPSSVQYKWDTTGNAFSHSHLSLSGYIKCITLRVTEDRRWFQELAYGSSIRGILLQEGRNMVETMEHTNKDGFKEERGLNNF